MDIIISEDGQPSERVHSSDFELESNIQQLIHDNPNTIPLYEIDEDTQLFIAAREFPTNSGPIDALGFDAKGNIYVIETKLHKNPDKRFVVAQALDYGASLWRHSGDFSSFVLKLDEKTSKHFGMGFKEKFNEFFGEDTDPNFLEAIEANLSDGVIKFVVLMDVLHDNLKDLVLFVNQNSKFDLYAVELKYYKHKSFEILIPKLYGTEVKKQVVSTKSSSARRQYTSTDETAFWSSVDSFLSSGAIDQFRKDRITELSNLSKLIAESTGGHIKYSMKNLEAKDVVALLLVDSDNRVTLYIDSDFSVGFYMWGKDGTQVDIVRDLLDALIAQQLVGRNEKHRTATQWFPNLRADKSSNAEISKFIEIFTEIAHKHLNS